MIVYGERDGSAPVDTLKQMPNSEVFMMMNAGHACYMNNNDEWHRLLYAFLQSPQVSEGWTLMTGPDKIRHNFVVLTYRLTSCCFRRCHFICPIQNLERWNTPPTLSFEQHVLHGLLPTQSAYDYNLWPRPHNLSLSCTMDHRNFIHRLAFKTPTNTQDPPLPLRSNCFNPTLSSFSPICYCYWMLFFNLFYMSM